MTRLRFLFSILLGIAALSLLSSATVSNLRPQRPGGATPAVKSSTTRTLVPETRDLKLETRNPEPETSAKGPNIVLITIDTLRADYVSAYGSREVQTPALDALAADGALFTTAYSQVPLTPPSHASILTGKYPASHGLRDFTTPLLPPGSTTIATILKSRGYQTAAFVSAYVLDSSWGFNQGFDFYYDHFDLQEFRGINPGNVQRRAGETIAHVIDWLKGARQPFFLWVHLFDPHHDYDPPQPFRDRYASNLYAGEVAYTDSEIARLVDALRKSDRYNNSLIIATSDHGESLGEHKEQEHGFFLYESTIRIPLIIKLPGTSRVTRTEPRPSESAGRIEVYFSSIENSGITEVSGWRAIGQIHPTLAYARGSEFFHMFSGSESSSDESPLAYARGSEAAKKSEPRPLGSGPSDPETQSPLAYARGSVTATHASASATRGKRIDLVAQTVDIVPTILQVLRIPLDANWKLDGRGFLGAILGKPMAEGFAYSETYYPRTTFGWKELKVYRERHYKFIDAPKPELYDLSRDPHESRNIYSSNQSLAHQLKQKLQRLEQGFHPPSKSQFAAGGDPEKVERLGALGYVAVSQPVPVRDSAKLPDPKDNIDVYNRILLGLQASEAGKIETSNSILREVAAQRPQLFIVRYQLGVNFLRIGEWEKALEEFDKARRMNPGFDLIDINSARALAALGRIDESIVMLRKVVEGGSPHLSARRQLGLMLSRARRFGEAAQVYRDILKQQPGDKQAIKSFGIVLVEDQKYTEGLVQLNRAVQAGAADALTYNFLGIALANTGRIQEAVNSYRQALEQKPDYDQARLNLSFALLKSGNAAEAQKEFQLLCASNPRLCKQYESYFR